MPIHFAAVIAAGLTLASTAETADSGGAGDPAPDSAASISQESAPTVALGISDYRSGGAVGVGLMLGSRAGLTIQAWPHPDHAFSFDIGATPFVNTLSLAAGWTGRPLHLRSPVGISAHTYIGVGFRMRVAFETSVDSDGVGVPSATPLLGVRIPIGFSFLLKDFPVEFFAEVAPAVDVWSAFGFDVEGVGGVRVYLPGATRAAVVQPEARPKRSEPPAKASSSEAPAKAKTLPAKVSPKIVKPPPKAETKNAAPPRKPIIPGKPGVPVVTLTIAVSGGPARTVEHRKEAVTLGKGPDATVNISDATLADLHCAVQLHAGNLLLVDFGSPAGTILNGTAVSSAPITTGDEIRIGATVITVAVTPTR